MFNVIHLRRILILFIIPIAILATGIIYLFLVPDIYIFPAENVTPFAYTDRYDQASDGQSLIKEFKISENEIIMSYILKEGVQFPYAGLSFQPSGFLFNLQVYDEIEIAVKSSRSETLRLFILLEIEDYSHVENFLSYLYLYKEIPVWQKKEVYHLKLSDFKIPEWWYDINNLSELDARLSPDFSRAFCFLIERPGDLPLEVTDTIQLSRFLITRNLISAVFPWIAAIILYYSVLTVFLWWIRYKKELRYKATRRNISYSFVEVQEFDNNEAIRIMEYLKNNYHFTDLSVKKVGQVCSVPAYKISAIIKKTTRLSFPAFVNYLRLKRAKKLLEITDMAIIDIAMESGFTNVSHFNKVFRLFENTSPRDYRKRTQSINEE